MSLPDGPLVAFYGDDFTGSASVMEVLSFAGLPTLLFLDVPTPERFLQYQGYRAIGIAGTARAQSPEWMRLNLPIAYRLLKKVGAPINHYKTCSTLDSAPHIGSIGCAMDLAREIFEPEWQPFFLAAPEIRRFQAFGHLFAGYEGKIYRIDRHPVMQRHPVTPMDESDVRLHLAKQTNQKIGLVDLVSMKSGQSDERLKSELEQGASIIAIDGVDAETLTEAGRLIWQACLSGGPVFAGGSQGIEYALTAHWRQEGLLEASKKPAKASSAKQILAVSGSVSPVTATQIGWARQNGFSIIKVDASKAVDERLWHEETERAILAALEAVHIGTSPLVVSAEGPDDPAVATLVDAVSKNCISISAVNESIGRGLGKILLALIRQTGIRRAVISGGDTSGFGAMTLGIYALEAMAPIAPGAALCGALADDPLVNGLEIALKGGQMGGADYFGAVRNGG